MRPSSAEKQKRRDYREKLWRSTPHPKLFPFPRLAVTIMLSGAQFAFSVLRHKWNPKSPTPQLGREMLIFSAIAIIFYMVIYALEWSWNHVVLSPMIMDSENQAKLKQQGDEVAVLTEKLKLVEELNTGLPPHRPIVVPLGYGEHKHGSYGLFVANDRYPAYDVSIPDVVIGTTRVAFKGKLTRLVDKDKEFFEARIEHSANSGSDGSQLSREMVKARIPVSKVAIVYKDGDGRWYRSNCVIERDVEFGVGLSVSFVDQELIPAPPQPVQ